MAVVTTTKMSDGAITLGFSRDTWRKLEVEPFWPEFETRIPELFSVNDNCRVGFIEYLPFSNSEGQHAGDTTESGEEDSVTQVISSLGELNTVLGVCDLFYVWKFNLKETCSGF
jgi:hypothetical protein